MRALNGKLLKYRFWDLSLHLIRDCPHRISKETTENISYAYARKMGGCLLLLSGWLLIIIKCTVLDSGCTATVAVKLCIECYLQSLSKDGLLKVIHKESNKAFKFVGGKKILNWNSNISLYSSCKHISVKVDIIEKEAKIKLDSKKEAKIKLDFIMT